MNKFLKNLFFSVVGLFFLNIGFILFCVYFSVDRPIVNVDYALILFLLAFKFYWIGLFLGLIFLAADILVIASQIFPFPRILDIIYLLKFSHVASDFYFVIIFLIITFIFIKINVAIFFGKRSVPLASIFLFNSLLFFMIVVNFQSEKENIKQTYRKNITPVIFSQFSALVSMRSHAFLDHFEAGSGKLLSGAEGATSIWRYHAPDQLSDRLLLVVVESWGVVKNNKINLFMLDKIKNMPIRGVGGSNLKFSGITIEAELRELCGVEALGVNLRDVQAGFDNCLPNQLKAENYRTMALHGATGLMYDRRHWYPRAGFEKMIFFEDKVWPRRCYSFPGACDLDVFPELENFFSQPGKRFMYWLTLNSHSPYDSRDVRGDRFQCAEFNILDDSEACKLFKLQTDFFDGLAKQLQSESMRNVEVIVVGDHQPVMMNIEERDGLFVPNAVPWMHFKTAH